MADSAETVKKTVDTATASVKATAEKTTAQAEKMQAAGARV
ncbi:MAG: phasin family protein, partial [Brevundimonas sp.]